jgi:hypothetical protein
MSHITSNQWRSLKRISGGAKLQNKISFETQDEMNQCKDCASEPDHFLLLDQLAKLVYQHSLRSSNHLQEYGTLAEI